MRSLRRVVVTHPPQPHQRLAKFLVGFCLFELAVQPIQERQGMRVLKHATCLGPGFARQAFDPFADCFFRTSPVVERAIVAKDVQRLLRTTPSRLDPFVLLEDFLGPLPGAACLLGWGERIPPGSFVLGHHAVGLFGLVPEMLYLIPTSGQNGRRFLLDVKHVEPDLQLRCVGCLFALLPGQRESFAEPGAGVGIGVLDSIPRLDRFFPGLAVASV